MIREQIVEIWCPFYEDCTYRKEDKDACFNTGGEWCVCKPVEKTDRTVSLLCAEIEKMGLSDVEIAEFAVVCWAALEPHERHSFKQVAQAQLQKVIKELKEGK